MTTEILIRNYGPEDTQALANIYYNTIHCINSKDYTQEQLDVWAPASTLETEGWTKKFSKTKPIVAVVEGEVVGFAEFEANGHIDCFYCHHAWIGKGIGSALMQEVFARAKKEGISTIFVEVSITAKPFFEKQGFKVIAPQTVVKQGVSLKNFKMEKSVLY